jgi:hypothetical protein
MHVSDWYGCYGDSWKGLIVDDAFAHPAKVSRALARRIYDHLFKEGWLRSGDAVVDPFAGIGGFAFDAVRLGCRWVGVELERRFVDIGAGVDCTGIGAEDWIRFYGRWRRAAHLEGRSWCPRCLAEAEAIDDPPAGPLLFAARSSASYRCASGRVPSTEPHRWPGNIDLWRSMSFSGDARLLQGDSQRLLEVLAEAGQLQAAISSPPFGAAETRDRSPYSPGYVADMMSRAYTQSRQGETAGNLAQLETTEEDLVAVVSSPPFESSVGSDDPDKRGGLYRDPRRRGDVNLTATYGDSPGQLGAEDGETFWNAARAVVEQVFAALAPGGYAVWVTKAFVRDGERVDFPDQWRRLCEAVGFETLHKHRTWMVQEHGVQLDLFGGEEAITKQHKSFFRLLAERKGSPHVDYEVVWCMRKPLIDALPQRR